MTSPIRMTGVLDPRDSWESEGCPIVASLELVGTRSAMLILREAYYGATRFDEFTARTGLSDPVVSERLKELSEAGVLTREDYKEPGQRTRKLYRLTEMGEELMPVVVAFMHWGNRWLPSGPKGSAEVFHHDCGSPVLATLECERGHSVKPGELDLRARRASKS
jgi:DNA-binding HxlR family transcriptional regulator